MWEEIVKYAPVYYLSMIKFILGPLTGAAIKLHIIETTILTILGMMTSVFVISIIGDKIRKRITKIIYKNRQLDSSKMKRINKILKAYGAKGAAFLTPLLLTPILGTIVAISCGESRRKILVYMLVSAVLWAILLTYIVYKFGYLIGYLPEPLK